MSEYYVSVHVCVCVGVCVRCDPLLVTQDVNLEFYTYVAVIYRVQGTVIIIANQGERIDIPPGAILENKIVSGNLRILDH
jgi:hypothetical protein